MAVKPVKNVPKRVTQPTNPGWGNAATVAKPKGLSQTNAGWGGATNANILPGHDVPGTVAAPSQPFVTAPPSGGGGGGGGGGGTPGYWNTPDYAALLKGDWEPEQAAIQGDRTRQEAETAFQLALRRAFVDYGGSVDKLDDRFKKYIDDPTIEAAKTNKFSTLAQNLSAQTKALANQRAQLAARGMTRSGANTTLTRKALEARELADYGAGRSFMGGAEEGLQGLASTEQSIAEAIAAAKSRAAARIAQENPQTWVPGTGEGYEGESAYTNEPAGGAAAPAAPAAAAPWAGISWGNGRNITTKADLIRNLGPGVTWATWARNHPDAAAKLR